jgi:hypothetical protein
VVIPFILFFLAGLVFGYAAPGGVAWIALAIPLVLALGALVGDGLEGEILLKTLIALVVTAVGVILGQLLERRSPGEGTAT